MGLEDETSDGEAGKEFALGAQGEEGESETGEGKRGSLSPGDKVPEGREGEGENQNCEFVIAQVGASAPDGIAAQAVNERAQVSQRISAQE